MSLDMYGHSRYARAVASVDCYLNRLTRHLEENTLTILTADHGEQIARSRIDALLKKLGRKTYKKLRYHHLTNLHFAKGIRWFHVGHGHAVYDSLVKVPLIFHNRDLVPQGESICQIRHFDLFPTIMDTLGLNHPRVTGTSARQMLTGGAGTNRDVHLQAAGNVIPTEEEWIEGIRVDNKYKYVYSPFRADFREELYFLRDDPSERFNIANRHPAIVAALRERIREMKSSEIIGDKIEEEDQQELLDRLRELGYIE